MSEISKLESFLDNDKKPEHIRIACQRHIENICRQNLSSSSINQKTSIIKNFLKYCESRHRHDSWLIKFPEVKKTQKIPQNIPIPEMERILSRLKSNRRTWIDYRNYALIVFLYATGVRISEALSFAPSHFLTNNTLIVKGKGEKERIVFIPTRALTAIAEYEEIVPHLMLKNFWLSYKGVGLCREIAYRIVRRITGYHPHAFRHTFASHLYENGCDILEIQELLGHSSPNTTQRYIGILSKKHLLSCVRKYHPLSCDPIFKKIFPRKNKVEGKCKTTYQKSYSQQVFDHIILD